MQINRIAQERWISTAVCMTIFVVVVFCFYEIISIFLLLLVHILVGWVGVQPLTMRKQFNVVREIYNPKTEKKC